MSAAASTDATVKPREGEAPSNKDDLLLSKKVVRKLVKSLLPPNASSTAEAQTFLQEAASEFLLFVCSESSDMAKAAGKTTIDGDDIIQAMDSLGFDNYKGPLQVYLSKLRALKIEPPPK